MRQTYRIGSHVRPFDPCWVQVREAVNQKALQFGFELMAIESSGRPVVHAENGAMALALRQKNNALIDLV